jgi:hypothetical protein
VSRGREASPEGRIASSSLLSEVGWDESEVCIIYLVTTNNGGNLAGGSWEIVRSLLRVVSCCVVEGERFEVLGRSEGDSGQIKQI